MTSREHGSVRWFSAIGRALALAALLVHQCWMAGPATAQSSAAQAYKIAPGDKVGVTVLGQPDLSGESTVDQTGNLRLPIVGDVRAADLTLDELEKSVSHSLERGYVRHPVVTAKIAEFLPVYVLGIVKTPGPYSYREGLTVLGAIARAGGVGLSAGQTASDPLQAEERVRLLEISRVTLLARRARLLAQRQNEEHIKFPNMSGIAVDPARVAQIRDSEESIFAAERKAERQEIEALENQLPRLNAEIASLKQQADLERRQRDLNEQLIKDYQQLEKSGLARKPNFIEVKREEARIDENVARLQSEALKAELAIADLQFRMTELHNTYQRRVMTELRDTDRSLMELTVTLPAAQRAYAAGAQQLGWLTADRMERPALLVVRTRNGTTEKHEVSVDFVLQPGDVVQVGTLFSPMLSAPAEQVGVLPQMKKVESAVR